MRLSFVPLKLPHTVQFDEAGARFIKCDDSFAISCYLFHMLDIVVHIYYISS